MKSNETLSVSFLESTEAILKRDNASGNNAQSRAGFSQTARIGDGAWNALRGAVTANQSCIDSR